MIRLQLEGYMAKRFVLTDYSLFTSVSVHTFHVSSVPTVGQVCRNVTPFVEHPAAFCVFI